MIQIKVPSKLTIFALDCVVDTSDKARDWLKERNYYGFSTCSEGMGRRILIDNTLGEKEFSHTFIHEVLEFIKGTGLGESLKHWQVIILSNCLHQIMEQMKIRFVREM